MLLKQLQFISVIIFLILSCFQETTIASEKKTLLICVISFDTKFLDAHRGLADGLKQMGYQENQLRYVIHDLKKDLSQIPAIIDELHKQKCDLILTTTTPVVLAVKKALEQTNPIPVIFTMVADPVGSKVVPSLKNPDGSITGISYNAFSMLPKRLALFSEAFPDMKTIAIFYNQGESWISEPVQKLFMPTAESLGFQVISYDVRDKDSMINVMKQFDPSVEGLFMVPDPLAISLFAELLHLSRQYKLPLMVLDNMLLKNGGVMGYSPSFYSIGVQAATIADRILSGTSPKRLAIQNPMETRLVISMREAKRLGLKPSDSILNQSDDILR